VLTRILRHSTVRYLLVGGLSYLTDIGMLWLLHSALSVSLAIATALAYATGFVVNFGINRTMVFPGGPGLGTQLFRYVTLVVANCLTTLAVVLGLSTAGLNYLAAKTIAVVLLAIANYSAYRHWVFGRPATTARVEPLVNEPLEQEFS
jgi:putative flippase GtrA